jgi:signal transduction histidine kinase/CheY-like chemotaxis protein/HPt (histidine-containing phosphotransfer) domain-containing protein
MDEPDSPYQGPRRHAPSLRRLLAILLGALALLVGALFLVASLQASGVTSQARTENRRTTSFLIADSLRQSSNDLTNMVRLYVASGDPRYRAYYDEILAIRAGTAPRPLGYDSSFWDRVLASGKGFVRYGPKQSLTAQMRAAHFAPAEFRALQASLKASNGLATVERDVIARVARRIREGVDARYFTDIRPDYERLADTHYLKSKGTIMRAIGRFTALVNARTLREVQQARAHVRALNLVQVLILVAIVLVGIAALAILARIVLRPLDELIAATRRIAGGDYAQRVQIRSVSDLERVAGSFNEMAGAIESDVGARELAEQEAVAARQAAEHANRAKSTFLAAMSHELRTPMIGVTGMLEVLAQSDLSPSQRQMVATADSSALSLLQIIGDILDLSKIEAAKLELSPSTIDLRAVVGACAETFVHTASAKGLLLTCNVDERLARAHVCDALRLRQVVSNFLSNAVKFTEVGGIEVEVRVLAEPSDGAQDIEISVSDTGIGIDDEQQRRLFEEFAQAESSTSRRFGGTGLGLVISKRLAVLMGGDVTMQSTVGKGTTMRLRLELAVGDPDEIEHGLLPATGFGGGPALPASRPMPTREQALREGSLLLVVEDHPVNRTVICSQLETIGFQADTAPDGQAAYELFRTGGHAYGLVLTDLNMPHMDGFELARAIREHEDAAGGHVPIIALTASVMQGEPEKCRDAGMDDFGAKPTTIPFLASKLRQWLPDVAWPAVPAVVAVAARGDASPGRAAGLDGGGDGRLPAAGSRDDDGVGSGPIDPSVLEEMTGGDAALAAEVLGEFVTTTRADLDALLDAFAARGVEDVRRLAHRIRGASRAVGAPRIADVAQQMESLAALGSQEWARFQTLHGELSDALDEVVAAVAG